MACEGWYTKDEGWKDGGSMSRKGVKERLPQVVSAMTAKLDVLYKVSRFKLQLRTGLRAIKSRGGGRRPASRA